VFSGTVHANVRDLERALILDAEGEVTGFNYGPTDAGLDTLLLTAMESLILCLRGAFSVLPSPCQSALDAIHQEFTSLHEEVFPENET